jgi:hypothetical protein
MEILIEITVSGLTQELKGQMLENGIFIHKIHFQYVLIIRKTLILIMSVLGILI